MRDASTDPAVGRRLAMARYAAGHSKAQAARHFGCCWATIQAAVRRVAQYQETGNMGLLQNQPRGQSGRVLLTLEEQVIAIYQESLEPSRPDGRRYSAAKVARLLKQRHQIEISRKTAWQILRRRGVWNVEAGHQKRAVQRFERSQPNELWQIDLIEKEPTAIGDVYGVPIIDDHSRYLVGLRFFLSKNAETVLLTTYLAMRLYGTPQAILSDRGGQFVDATGVSSTPFQEALQALGIDLVIAHRAQTKGKEERLNQFIERDFLDEVRWQINSLDDLNRRANTWCRDYNHNHIHETIHCSPSQRYHPGVKIDDRFLRSLFATEVRRKVTQEATVRFQDRHFKVPERYIGWNLWVANFFDLFIEIRVADRIIATHLL